LDRQPWTALPNVIVTAKHQTTAPELTLTSQRAVEAERDVTATSKGKSNVATVTMRARP